MSAHDGRSDAFRRALEEAARAASWPCDGARAPSLGAGFDLLPARREGGGEARWGLAMEWDDPPPPAPVARSDREPASADVLEAVAAELDFAAELTEEVLAKRWRSFVWRNHPDRQPPHDRDRANARVAVANALYDQARRDLIRR